jgi:hypothetical protein
MRQYKTYKELTPGGEFICNHFGLILLSIFIVLLLVALWLGLWATRGCAERCDLELQYIKKDQPAALVSCSLTSSLGHVSSRRLAAFLSHNYFYSPVSPGLLPPCLDTCLPGAAILKI